MPSKLAGAKGTRVRLSKKQRDEERKARQDAELLQRTGIDIRDVLVNSRGFRLWTEPQQRLLVEVAKQAPTVRDFGVAIGVNPTQISSWSSRFLREDAELRAGQEAAAAAEAARVEAEAAARRPAPPPAPPVPPEPPVLPVVTLTESHDENGHGGGMNGLPTRPKGGRPQSRNGRLAEFDDEDDFVGMRAKSVDDAIRYLSKLRNVPGRVQVKIYLPT